MTAPLANVFTLGVSDLPTQRQFYRALGWPHVVDDHDYAAFELRGAVLGLFPVDIRPGGKARQADPKPAGADG